MAPSLLGSVFGTAQTPAETHQEAKLTDEASRRGVQGRSQSLASAEKKDADLPLKQ